MAKSINMENEFFHIFVKGTTKTITKTTKGVKRELSRFISADELCYEKNNIESFDQNAFMYSLFSTSRNIDELKQKIIRLYNTHRERIEAADEKMRHHRLESVDEVLLCVGGLYAPQYNIPTYHDEIKRYSTVPAMFSESYTPESSYGPGTSVRIVKDKALINNPYNLLKDAITKMIQKNRNGVYKGSYKDYYDTLLKQARIFFEGIIKTNLNAKITHYDRLVRKYIDQYEELRDPEIRIYKETDDGEYYVEFKNNFGRLITQSFEGYISCAEQKDFPKLRDVYKEVEDEKKRISKYVDVKSNEDFFKTIFENEADLFKYGELNGNSIKFYVYLSYFANQIKLQEAKRIIYNHNKEKNGIACDERNFLFPYPTDSVEYELAARGSVEDIVKLFEQYNQSAIEIGSVDYGEDTPGTLSMFDTLVEGHFSDKSKYEPNFRRVLEKRNPTRLL